MATLKLAKKYDRYPHYKDSGVEWIGEIPEEWKLVPLKALFKRVKRNGFADEKLLSVYRDYGVIDKSTRDDNFNKPSEDLSTYLLVKPGDLVTNKMKTWQGSIAISSIQGIVSPAYYTYEPNRDFDSRYFHYLVRSSKYIAHYVNISTGIRVNQWDLDPMQFKNMALLIPDVEQQRKIAAYLDKKTALIDVIVEKKKKQIELLREKRAAIINRAVTKGFDSNVKLVDSGLEWIGMIPEGWKVAPIKHHVAMQEGPGIMAADFKEQGVPLLRIKNLKGHFVELQGCNFLDPDQVAIKWKQFRLDKGDLLISGSASSGIVSEVGGEAVGAIPYTGLIRLKAKDVTREFLRLILSSRYFNEQIDVQKTGTAMQHYGPSHLKKVFVTLPPKQRQVDISRHVARTDSAFEQRLRFLLKSIVLLQEFKSALISHVVTGKVKV